MAYCGVLEDIQKCVDLQEPARMPFLAMSEEFDVRMAGMVYEDFCQDADKVFECQKLVVKEFGYDWCWLQIDDCIEFEVLGVGCKGAGNVLRATCDYLPTDPATLKGLRMPDFSKDGRLPMLLEAIRRCKEHFGDTVCVVGRTAAPFSSAALLYGISETMLMLIDNPDLLHATMEYFTELQTQFGLAQMRAGADAVWLGDCCASSDFISPAQFREFASPYAKRVGQNYQMNGGWTFYHASEYRPSHLAIMADLGFSVLSVSERVDIGEAMHVVEGKVCLMGNLDPIKVLRNGTPESVTSESRRILNTAGGPGFLFDSGEMIPRDTPEENMRAMASSVQQYNQSRGS